MDKQIMINAEHLKKRYRLGEIGSTTLQHELQSWWAEKRGREDPNQKIGNDRTGTFYALDDVSFQVHRGETVGLIGANGAGKSTLLKILCRITAPTEGRAELYGRITSMLEIGTGFHGEMTGRENIFMNGAILGMKRSEINDRLEEIIEFSEVRDFIDTPVKRYSSGMYTKLGFSVAAHLDSEIMIMDEVLAVGDAAFQNKCIARMRTAAAEEGRTVLYVSHNMNQIRQLCRRCIVLGHGTLIYDGDTEHAIEHYLGQYRSDKPRKQYSPVRPVWLEDHSMRVQYADYPLKDNVFFYGDESVRVRIGFDVYADIRNLCLRVEIRSANESRIGTYFFYDLCNCLAGESKEITVEWSLSAYTDGTFFAGYTFFTRSENGVNHNLDYVEGLTFLHAESTPSKKLAWESNWGFLELSGGRVIDLRTVEKHGAE